MEKASARKAPSRNGRPQNQDLSVNTPLVQNTSLLVMSRKRDVRPSGPSPVVVSSVARLYSLRFNAPHAASVAHAGFQEGWLFEDGMGLGPGAPKKVIRGEAPGVGPKFVEERERHCREKIDLCGSGSAHR